MNFPAIAKRTYEELKDNLETDHLIATIIENLRRIYHPQQKATFIHRLVDEFNKEVFSNPIVKELSPCKLGCSACCHTQVSVTDSEAILLAQRVREGVTIDETRLTLQAGAGNDSEKFYKISYQERACVFLDEKGQCRVYEDRPSVCRTNAVLGDSSQCDTSVSLRPVRLIKTPLSDLAIYASFKESSESGTLPSMIGNILLK